MEKHLGAFAVIRNKKRLSANLALLVIVSMLVPSGLVFAEDDFYRNTKDNFAPRPYLQPDMQSGAFEQSLPIAIPLGRGGVQPDLKLSYSSANTRLDSLFGYGWSMNIPYIERLNKAGVDNLFNQDIQHSFFYSSLSGELLPVSTTTPVGGSFLGYSLFASTLPSFKFPSRLALEDTTIVPSDLAADTVPVMDTPVIGDAVVSQVSATPLLDTVVPSTPVVTSIAKGKGTTLDSVRSPNGAFAAQIDVPVELTSERTPTMRKFINVDRERKISTLYRLYPAPVQYFDAQTQSYEEIDSRLVKGDGEFHVTKAPYEATLDTTGKSHLLSFTHAASTINIDVPGVSTTTPLRAERTDEYTMLYPDLLGAGIDLEVITKDNSIVENVVIRNIDALANLKGDYLEIPFTLSGASTLTLKSDSQTLAKDQPLVSSGVVTITDTFGTPTYILPPMAYSADASTVLSNVSSVNISYTQNADGSITFTKRIPRAWLEKATYPVRSDAIFSFSTPLVDGYISTYVTPTEAWSSLRGRTTGNVDNNAALVECRALAETLWRSIGRCILKFDTSSIPPTDTIATATLSLYVNNHINQVGAPDRDEDLDIVSATTSASTYLSSGDYAIANFGTTVHGFLDYDATTNGAYNNINLSTTSINKAGVTTFGALVHADTIDSVPPSPGANTDLSFNIAMSEATGTSTDPYLTIETVLTDTSAPIALWVGSQTNPSGVATSSPQFSAVYQSASSTALASSYEIQVTSSSTSWSSLYWDSGKVTLSSSTPSGVRTPQIFSTTTFVIDGTKYYWRMKFWNQVGTAGDWSASGDYFVMDYSTDYDAKVENGDFISYHLISGDGGWTAKDKKGWRYVFGSASSSRLDNGNAATSTFRWMLESITDPNGNAATYSYYKDSATGQVYPYKVNYTSNGGSAGIYEVEFARENRPDIATSSLSGFPVVTSQRIKEILVRTNGQLTHRYQLSYVEGNNTKRSLLSSVGESGWGAGVGTTTLPIIQYGYSTSTNTWTESDGAHWSLPSPLYSFVDSSSGDGGVRVVDANGDSLPDILYSTTNAWLNTGSTWATATTNYFPVSPGGGGDNGVRLADVNGDGIVDIVQSIMCYWGVNCGSTAQNRVYYGGPNGWTLSGRTLPVSFVTSVYNITYNDFGYTMADVNGDGLADITGAGTFINNGSQWVYDSAWNSPVTPVVSNHDNGVRFIDVNGDGLVDVVASKSGVSQATYLNTGHGWGTSSTPWLPPVAFVDSTGDTGARFADSNSDGLPDITDNAGVNYLNTGLGWVASGAGLGGGFVFIQSGVVYDRGFVIDDVNSDGLIDIVQSRNGYYDCNCTNLIRSVKLKNGVKSDVLTSIKNEIGGTQTIAYGRSGQIDSMGNLPNPSLAIAFDTVKTIATDPRFGGAIATTTYDFRGGSYYFGSSTDRQFAGFGSTTKTNAQGHTIRTYFHQGNTSDSSNGEYNDHISKTGKPYRIEMLNGTTSAANLFSRTINKWARADYGDGRNFVKLIQSLVQTFDGDSTHRDMAIASTYDDTLGNVSERDNYGEVSGASDGTFTDLGADKASTTYTYAASSTNSIMSLLSRELVTDQLGATVKDTKWTYDNLSFGSVSAGNQTKEERLISGSTYASTTKAYNAYGLVTQSRDPLGNPTNYTYDLYNLYPASTTNALSQSMSFYYDYSSGKVATSSDENSKTMVTLYDGLDRPTEEKQPDFMSASTMVTRTTYSYTDSTTTPSSVFRKDYLSNATTTEAYTYLDGLGRTIQSKREAESVNGWITNDTIYNTIGAVGAQSLPYFATTSAYTSATTAAYFFTNFAYDAAGRTKTVADVFGTTTNTYNDWQLTVTDPLGNKKDLAKDTYGNLATVVEYLSPTVSGTTTYNWNLLGKLTKLTDASANIRNFTYDNLARLTGSEDLHSSGDTTFGTTSRQYDLAGNLIQVYTPRGNTISYTYDALNRVLSEDATTTSTGLTDIIYRYDTCTNGKGRVCEINANNAATTTYIYNPIGLVSTEAKQVSSTWATTSTSYLRTGAVDTLTYPTGHQIAYAYNDAGDLNRVRGLSVGSTTWNTLLESVTYGPHGKPTEVDYGNNTKTTYSYDATNLYHLTRKLTVSTSTLSTPEQLLFLGMTFGKNKLRSLALLETENTTASPLLSIEEVLLSVYASSTPSTTPLVIENETSLLIPSDNPVVTAAVLETPVIISPLPSLSIATSTLVEIIATSTRPVADSLIGAPIAQHANLKGQAIANIGSISKVRQGAYFIEVQRMDPIEGGVQVFARAWDANDRPIGFGDDGTVEIERFRFFNPRILVPDGTKRRVVDEGRANQSHEVNNYKEDLKLALQSELAHAISIAGKSGDFIVSGKIGNTTDTYYPDADPETSSVDGQVVSDSANGTWASIHDGTTGYAAYPSGQGTAAYISADTGTNGWDGLSRTFLLFDTANLPDTNTVSSATLSGKTIAKNNQSWSTTYNIYSSNPASNSDLVTADFDEVGTTPFSTAVAYASFANDSWNDWTLNASGISAVSKTGVSKFSFREATYDVANTAPTWVSGGFERIVLYSTESSAGTSDDSKLVVVHSAGGGGGGGTAYTGLQDINYTYDLVGNITKTIDNSDSRSAATTTYSYDGLYRLVSASTTEATSTPYSHTYAYDLLGNMTSKSDVGSYTYAGTGWMNPHAASAINGNALTYDNAGNVTSYNGMSNTWDYLNRLLSTTKSGTSTSYLYDHTGQRVTESINKGSGTTTTSFFSKYFSTKGATTTLSIYAGDMLIGTVEGNGTATSTLIAHADHLNSTSVWSNSTGGAGEVTAYYPFGEKRLDEKTGTAKASRQFIGEHQSDDVGMSYLNARYYDGGNGKFKSQDPVARDIGMMGKIPPYIIAASGMNPAEIDQTTVLASPQLLNSYSYSGNNPINYSDPSGKAGITFVPLGVAIFTVANFFVYGAADLMPGDQSAMRNFAGGNLQYVNDVANGNANSLPLLATFSGGYKPAGNPSVAGRASISLPTNRSQLGHIFRNEPGHLADTPANRQLLLGTANNQKNMLGVAESGNTWYGNTQKNGTQVWAETRNGNIVNGGVNSAPRTFNPQTGLSSPIKPKN